jgi:hypothetical protein
MNGDSPPLVPQLPGNRKLEVECVAFKPLLRNTLRGFADIRIPALRLVIHDVAVHQKNQARWAQLPAKAQLRDGALVKDATGKIQYWPMLEFESRAVSAAFSRAVITAVIKHAGAEVLEGVVAA